MIPHGVEVFVGLDPIDLRWGFNRLTGLVTERMGRDARCGALFVFIGKRREALKVLFFDGTGWCLFYKKLERQRGMFRVPAALAEGDSVVAIEERELDDLLDGIDLDTSAPRAKARRSSAAH
jgi:transposase